ncbi:MAG: RpiB/LacA/LacB family sugar-phosphate isomerase [Alphaproteobacteria bacterium]|nr:RpiB/LacA/LacB family sugar-phosphate isomerase [Alphaproteobacteria bacterium]
MQVKNVIIAADHAGCPLKEAIRNWLIENDIQVHNYGSNDPNIPVDYPDKAAKMAEGIERGEAHYGILVCGSGIGMSIAVNRYEYIRGALVWTPELAKLARQHNNANVLILGGRFIDEKTAIECVQNFLTTPFEGGRHVVRVNKLERMPHDFEK